MHVSRLRTGSRMFSFCSETRDNGQRDHKDVVISPEYFQGDKREKEADAAKTMNLWGEQHRVSRRYHTRMCEDNSSSVYSYIRRIDSNMSTMRRRANE